MLQPQNFPAPTKEAMDVIESKETIQLFITEFIVQEIVTWTNKRIKLVMANMACASATTSATEPKEIITLLGVHIVAGQQRDNHLSLPKM